jgi:Flp pilus assembly protein CpaB
MTLEKMKEASMPVHLVMMSADQIMGRQLRKDLRVGEPILTTDLYLEDEGPKYQVKPGFRAVSVSVSMARGGYAEAGDVVDVYFTTTPQASNRKTGTLALPLMTVPVTESVTVLEVTRPAVTALMSAVGYKSKDPSFLLQVPPDQADKFQALQGHGEFSLLIRPADEPSLAKGAEGEDPMTLYDALGIELQPPPQPPPTWITEYYRRGSRGAQQFPIPQPSPEEIEQLKRQYAEYQAQVAKAQGQQAPPDASPLDEESPTPAPVRRRPTLREPEMPVDPAAGESEPQIPYRASEPPAATPLPRSTAPAADDGFGSAGADDAGADNANPFSDDEVLP